MIVPLGPAYLEVIAVVDAAEAAGAARGVRVADAVAAGRTFVTWAVRTPDLDGLRQRLANAGWHVSGVRDGSRLTPGGHLLRWRTLELGGGVLPFLIQWDVDERDHPSRMAGAAGAERYAVRQIVLESDDPQASEKLRLLLGGRTEYSLRAGPLNGVAELVLSGPGGEIRIS